MGIPRLDKLAFPRDEAAKVLSLSVDEFSDLVNCGALPEPCVFHGSRGSKELWSRAALEAALNATNIETDEFEP